MRDGVWPLVSAATMRGLDRHSIETLGVPGELLMESAGRVVAEAVLAERAGQLAERAGHVGDVLVVCGTGNNGGDGFVAARHLHAVGIPVRVLLVGERRRLRGDAAANAARLERSGIPISTGAVRVGGAAVVVDALFGTGLDRPLTGAAAAAIRRLRAARPAARVVAVDLPSGLDADTGQEHGRAVEADLTVTIGLPKLGLLLEPGRSRAGRIVVARIGIADRTPKLAPDAELWTAHTVAQRLTDRPAGGHKGAFGHVLIVAGSRGKTGAAALAAEGAARTGAGLVTIACPASSNEILEVKCTEMMTAPVADGAEGGIARAALPALLALAEERDAVALGPGVGRDAETQKLVRDFALRCARALVIDADGLFPFAGRELRALKARKAATILTPHPGEAGHLLGISAAAVNRDRVAAARRLSAEAGSVVILKGATSIVADESGRTLLNVTGGPVLASGGTGDVLTGIVAALLGQGVAPFDAAAVGVWIHGRAGDRLAMRRGASGILASEVAAELPELCEALRSGALSTAAWPTDLAPSFP